VLSLNKDTKYALMKLFSARKFQDDSAAARLPLTADAMASAGINCC